jgi:copper(I)-binding protein
MTQTAIGIRCPLRPRGWPRRAPHCPPAAPRRNLVGVIRLVWRPSASSRRVAIVTLVVACSMGAPALSPASAAARTLLARAQTQGIELSPVTVTAAAKGGDSAIVFTFFNRTGHPILLHSVTSAAAKSNMVMIDNNMCQGNNVMIRLTNIYIASGWTQKFGYTAQGAMLIGLRQTLRRGQRILLEINWVDETTNESHEVTANAVVIAPPPNLQFGGSMPGMGM